MKSKSLTLLALLLLGSLTLSGCVFHHCGPRRCQPGCESSAGQPPCPQNENCLKVGCNKPCCVKMPAPETPAQ